MGWPARTTISIVVLMTGRFPYLRVLGRQLQPALDQCVVVCISSFIARCASPPQGIELLADARTDAAPAEPTSTLTVTGRVIAQSAAVHALAVPHRTWLLSDFGRGGRRPHRGQLYDGAAEECFASHGSAAEFLAFDRSEDGRVRGRGCNQEVIGAGVQHVEPGHAAAGAGPAARITA